MSGNLIITGASRGIGQALAEHYLTAGWKVFGCGTVKHGAYRHFSVDVTDEKAVVEMVRAVAAHGAIDGLLNNAGVASMNHLMLTPLASAQRIMATNFFGSLLFLREVAKVMVRQKTGRIVNFTTVAVPLDLESKAAVESLTRIAAKEFGSLGLCINAVGPTPVQTDLIRAMPKEKLEALLGRQAIRRYGSFQDVANVTDFFLSPRSDFMTGQILYLGGVMP
jgi:3-oxoacyl-[acyl-carrier protein] reductase